MMLGVQTQNLNDQLLRSLPSESSNMPFFDFALDCFFGLTDKGLKFLRRKPPVKCRRQTCRWVKVQESPAISCHKVLETQKVSAL